MRTLCIVSAFLLLVSCGTKEVKIAEGPFEPTWESLQNYEAPEWFRDAKFGIYMHWGPTSVSGVDGWYSRNMYTQGHNTYNYHVEHYGHPSEIGYKDIIPLWKAEHFDPDSLVSLFKMAGAKYITPVAVHHDNYDLWDSRHHKWNAVNYGPEKDIIGMWKTAVEKHGLRWGVTTHLARTYSWFQTNKGSDKDGPHQGVPYDGNDPDYVDLYLPFDADDNYKHPLNPPLAWRNHWMKRMIDLIDNYEIDFLYFDGGVPFQGEDDGLSGRKILAHLYNRSVERHGSLQAVQTIKGYADHGHFREGIAVEDIERGRMEDKSDLYWQTDDSMGPWFYAKDQEYRPVVEIVHELVDIVSKNGNLLLNVPLFPDGSLDQAGVDFLLQLGAWFDLYGEAIYGTRPYSIYGEGPTIISGGHFQEGNNPELNSEDARYTVKGDITYIFLMGWPDGPVHLAGFMPEKDATFNILGTEETADWKYSEEEGLRITIPESLQVDPGSPMSYTCVMKVGR